MRKGGKEKKERQREKRIYKRKRTEGRQQKDNETLSHIASAISINVIIKPRRG